MCFTLRLHTSAAPSRGGLTQALGPETNMIELSSQDGARDYVSGWLALNHEQLGLKQIKLQRNELPAKTLSVSYEAPGYLIDICVWDHSYCLDILVMEQSSDSFVFSEAGSCGNTTGLLERLTSFSNWVSVHAAGA